MIKVTKIHSYDIVGNPPFDVPFLNGCLNIITNAKILLDKIKKRADEISNNR